VVVDHVDTGPPGLRLGTRRLAHRALPGLTGRHSSTSVPAPGAVRIVAVPPWRPMRPTIESARPWRPDHDGLVCWTQPMSPLCWTVGFEASPSSASTGTRQSGIAGQRPAHRRAAGVQPRAGGLRASGAVDRPSGQCLGPAPLARAAVPRPGRLPSRRCAGVPGPVAPPSLHLKQHHGHPYCSRWCRRRALARVWSQRNLWMLLGLCGCRPCQSPRRSRICPLLGCWAWAGAGRRARHWVAEATAARVEHAAASEPESGQRPPRRGRDRRCGVEAGRVGWWAAASN